MLGKFGGVCHDLDPAVNQQCRLVAKLKRLPNSVVGQDHRRTSRRGGTQESSEAGNPGGVDARERLVEHQH